MGTLNVVKYHKQYSCHVSLSNSFFLHQSRQTLGNQFYVSYQQKPNLIKPFYWNTLQEYQRNLANAIISSNSDTISVKRAPDYYEHNFLCIKLLVVSGAQCTSIYGLVRKNVVFIETLLLTSNEFLKWIIASYYDICIINTPSENILPQITGVILLFFFIGKVSVNQFQIQK